MMLLRTVLFLVSSVSKHEATTTGAPSSIRSSTFSFNSSPYWEGNTMIHDGDTPLTLTTNFSRQMGLCQTVNYAPKVLETSCAGRCGQTGQVNPETAACSCDKWCLTREACCEDFFFTCYKHTMNKLDEHDRGLELFGVCGADGVNYIERCNGFSSIQSDIQLFRKWLSSATHTPRPAQSPSDARLSRENKTLKDFLGGSPLDIKGLYVQDRNSDKIFRNREVFSSCRPSYAKPVSVPRKIALVCARSASLNALRKAMVTEDDQTLLKNVDDYLQGCRVQNTAEVGLSNDNECSNSAYIDCFDSQGQKMFWHFSDLCLGTSASPYYKAPPYLLMSQRAGYVLLSNTLHCFYILPNNTKKQNKITARPSHDATLTIKAKSWYSRPTKEDNILHLDETMNAEDSFNRLQGFLISIKVFNVSLSLNLDCETLDIDLRNCHTLKYENFRMNSSVPRTEDFVDSQKHQFLLGVSVERLRPSRNRVLDSALFQYDGVPMCTCLRVQMSFANLTTLNTTGINLRGQKCLIQLKTNISDFVKEPWSGGDTEAATFESLLDIAEKSKPLLELSLGQTDMCSQDFLSVARICMYPTTRAGIDPPSSPEQRRCFYLDLTGKGQGSNGAVMRTAWNGYYALTLCSMVLWMQATGFLIKSELSN